MKHDLRTENSLLASKPNRYSWLTLGISVTRRAKLQIRGSTTCCCLLTANFAYRSSIDARLYSGISWPVPSFQLEMSATQQNLEAQRSLSATLSSLHDCCHVWLVLGRTKNPYVAATSTYVLKEACGAFHCRHERFWARCMVTIGVWKVSSSQ